MSVIIPKLNKYDPDRRSDSYIPSEADCFKCKKGSEFLETETGKRLAERSPFNSKIEDIPFVEGD